MASLTHVCEWSDNGWKRITAEQAAQEHPGGTVSAHSGLFMCELCGQYVTLTDGDIRMRYFKHSASEKSKDCPERTFATGYSISYSAQEHDLPIRIVGISATSFRFEVGLIRAPISLLDKDFYIEIRPKGTFDVRYVFSKERLNSDSITYLPIGERPFEKYTLNFTNGNDKLHEFWPTEIKGIDSEGTLFERHSGKKLSYDADVEIEKEYYLLIRGSIYKSHNGIRIQEIAQKRMKDYFLQLAEAGIGVFPSPFAHQISALEAAVKGENLFVSTGTGSGKTECFMWPLLAKMATEARNCKESWSKRGVRTIIMYPMNALVSDQVSRLRRMIGDPDRKYIKIFRNTCGGEVRRPQFGMYTGRTPYPGAQPSTEQDRKLEKTLARMSFPQSDSEKEFFNHLLKEGKIPAKADMEQFLQGLHESRHIPNDDDAELMVCLTDLPHFNFSNGVSME